MNAASPPLSQRTSCAAAGPQMGVVDWAQEARRAAVNAIDDALLQPLYRLHDKKVVHHTTKTLLAVEMYLLRFVEDPYMPEILKRVIRKAWELTCDEMNAELVEEVLDIFLWGRLAPDGSRLEYGRNGGRTGCRAARHRSAHCRAAVRCVRSARRAGVADAPGRPAEPASRTRRVAPPGGGVRCGLAHGSEHYHPRSRAPPH